MLVEPMRLITRITRRARHALTSLSIYGRSSIRRNSDLRVVTGADRSHQRSLAQLLTSVVRHEPGVEVVVWDLGLEPAFRDQLALSFPAVRFETFEFARHPAHFDISIDAGKYAWKPEIMWSEAARGGSMLIWLDAGDLLIDTLRRIRRYASVFGFYSPYSSGTVKDWTHPGMLHCLGADEHLLGRRNLSSGIVAFDIRNRTARELLTRWRACAVDATCIAPDGSSRENHRQDQAALTVLAHQLGLVRDGRHQFLTRRLGVTIHNDID